MNNIVSVKLDSRYASTLGVWQYDYGQVLRITGPELPPAVEVQFSLTEKSGETLSRVGTTVDGVTEVKIPDELLTHSATSNYRIYAYIYLTDETSGNTKYEITIPVRVRSKPTSPAEDPETDPDLFRETVVAVNASAERAKMAEQNAKASATEAGKYAASASESAVTAEKTKEDALRKVGEKKREAIEAIQNQEETSVGKITTHTDDEIQRIQNQTADSKAGLEQTITNADASKKELEHSIETAGTSKTALDKSVELAGTAKTELDTSIREAGTAKTALDESTETAGMVQETLSATVKQAGALDTSLGEKIETGTQLKTDLVASGEKAVQDIQTAGSEQLSKMQAVAEAFTADREQIATNKEDIGSLKEDIVQLNDGNYFDKYEISNYELGYLNPKNGDNNDLEATDIKIRNNRAWWLKKGSIIKSENGWSFWFAIFNKNKGLTKITAPNYTDKYIVDEDCYIKLSIRKNDNSSLVEYVDSANEYIHVYYPVYNIYQGITLTDGICTVKASDWVNNTDNASDEIENMIAFTASFSNRKIVFDKDVTINRAILLPSNTEVVIDNCTITQADYTFDNVFRGANVILDSTQLAYVPSVIDKIENITIRGEGTANIYGPSINKKDGDADMVGHTYGARTHQIDFCNVNNFKLSGIEFYKTRGWTIELEFVTNFEVSNIVFHTGATQNGDGLDVRGGCAYGKIFNLSGSTGDDMIAFNTHVSLNSPQFNKYPNSTAKYPLEFGYLFNIEECYKNKNASDIHDISIENVSKDGGRYHLVIFLAQYGHKIYNVSMEKLRMNKDYVSAGDNSIISFYNYNEKDFADGDISNIRMNDVECSATHPYSTDPVAVIYSSLKLKNVWANKVVQKNSGDVVSNLKYMDGVTITNS